MSWPNVSMVNLRELANHGGSLEVSNIPLAALPVVLVEIPKSLIPWTARRLGKPSKYHTRVWT